VTLRARGALALALPLLFVGVVVGCAPAGRSNRARGSVVVVNEENEREAFGRRMRVLLRGGNYDRLEAIADSLERTMPRWRSGRSVLLSFYDGFGTVDQKESAEQWAAHLAALREWADARPNSSTARFAVAEALIGRGWAARGYGWSSTVSDDRARRFSEDLDEAGTMLMACSDDQKSTFEWHSAAMNALHGSGWDADSVYRLIAIDALERFPDEPRFYTGTARHLMPRWYGEKGEWEQFANESTAELPDSIRDEYYARIVMDQSRYAGNVFRENQGLSWERTRRGLEAWHRRLPASTQPVSALAKLGAMAGDIGVARQAFASLRDTVDLEVWGTGPTYRWARGWVERSGR